MDRGRIPFFKDVRVYNHLPCVNNIKYWDGTYEKLDKAPKNVV
jgi:hypothetical protein